LVEAPAAARFRSHPSRASAALEARAASRAPAAAMVMSRKLPTKISKRSSNDVQGKLVHSVVVLDFHQIVGESAGQRYPLDAKLPLSDDHLSGLSIPEGGHLFDDDWTYLITSDPETGQQLFGIAYFMNHKDPSLRRGAKMRSMLLLSRRPYFSFYLKLLRVALKRYFEAEQIEVLSTLYNGLNGLSKSKALSLSLWGQSFAVDTPTLPPDHFSGASLLSLVLRFKEDTMLLWWALLLQLRVLFCGQPAHAVGDCCLAAPLLVAPLQGFSSVMSPYVPLSFAGPVEDCGVGGRYICGVTNRIFEMKQGSYDAIGLFPQGTVTARPELRLRVTGKPLRFIKNVLSAIQRESRGELWVREQFRQYTESVLIELQIDNTSHRALAGLTKSPMYEEYLRRGAAAPADDSPQGDAAEATRRESPLEYYRLLLTTEENQSRSKLLFNLEESLKADCASLTDFEALIEEGAVGRLTSAAFLTSDSANVRKYSVSVLAQLCTIMRGQVAVLTAERGVLQRIVEMISDPRPQVSAAAANLLEKISSLFIGVQTLAATSAISRLTEVLLDPDNQNKKLRMHLASTLLQACRSSKHAPAHGELG